MATKGQKAAGVMAAVFAAAALGAGAVVSDEGWVTKTYKDPIAISTVCAGVTGAGITAGRTYTDAECEQLTAQAMVKIGLAIAQCLPEQLPPDTRAAFQRFAYNLGPAGFCKSRVAVDARAGKLGLACSDLRLFIYAGGRKLPGLVTRRASEQAQCEKGLRG